jgi:lipoyl(octanoyl) transferase
LWTLLTKYADAAQEEYKMDPMKLPFVEWLGRISFKECLLLQEHWVKEAEKGSERLLLLEHDPVFTIGRTHDTSSLMDSDALPFPVHRINRGGQATYHGPGQLVGYPILNLAARGRDLHHYLRFLENVIIAILNEYGLKGERREGLTGVWVENRKIASIGIGVRRWISMHGFALNVGENLEGFSNIIPCGINGVTITSLSKETGRSFPIQEVAIVTKNIFLGILQRLPNGYF